MLFIKKKKRAFTLLELMIVIGIIAMLAAIAMAAITRAREQARLTACIANMRNIAVAIEQYVADNPNQLPPDDIERLLPDYITTLPIENKSNAKYGYISNSITREYTIYCPGLNHIFLDVPEDYPRYCSPGGQFLGIPGK